MSKTAPGRPKGRLPLQRPDRGPKAKATISISRGLLAYADQRAASSRTTRSQVIEDLLAEARRREEDELAIEGYRLFNAENEEFAGQALPLFREVMALGTSR